MAWGGFQVNQKNLDTPLLVYNSGEWEDSEKDFTEGIIRERGQEQVL